MTLKEYTEQLAYHKQEIARLQKEFASASAGGGVIILSLPKKLAQNTILKKTNIFNTKEYNEINASWSETIYGYEGLLQNNTANKVDTTNVHNLTAGVGHGKVPFSQNQAPYKNSSTAIPFKYIEGYSTYYVGYRYCLRPMFILEENE